MNVLGEVLMKVGRQEIGVALDSWEQSSHHEFCAEGLEIAKLASDRGRKHIWNNLGRYFLGRTKNKLEDEEYEVWPSTWQPR